MARIKVREVLAIEGITIPADVKLKDSTEAMEMIEQWVHDSACPACCDECGEVEHDGHCEHGHPSVLMALGLI